MNCNYEIILEQFIEELQNKIGESLVMVYLSGSYARGDANDNSDIDLFCIFDKINEFILESVGLCVSKISQIHKGLEINVQSLSVNEYRSENFENWSDSAVAELNGVLLFGKELIAIKNIKDYVKSSYKKILVEVLLSVRHYICADEPKEKLTHKKIKMWVLKPLMFALRQERFCTTGVYPLSINDLLESYKDENRILVEYFIYKNKFEKDINENHKKVLMTIHNMVCALLN